MSEWSLVIATVVIQVITAAYVYGKLTAKVSSNHDWLGAVSERVDDNTKTLSQHGERIARLEAN